MTFIKAYIMIAIIAFLIMILPFNYKGIKPNLSVYTNVRWWQCNVGLAIMWPITLCLIWNDANKNTY